MFSAATLAQPISSAAPRQSINDIAANLIVTLDTQPELSFAEVVCPEIFSGQPFEIESPDGVSDNAGINLLEFGVSAVCFGMDVACQVIALAAAMPLIPKKLTRAITSPLVDRLFRERLNRR